MTVKSFNLKTLMTCPICGDKSLEILQIELGNFRSSITFRCDSCRHTIHREDFTEKELIERISKGNYFHAEIKKRKK